MIKIDKALVVFQGNKIRRLLHNKEWWFSVIDIVTVLIEQEDYQKSRKYWNKLSQRLREEGSEVVTKCHQLKLKAEDGKLRLTDCANTESMFRIVQSIPSKKAEPFKRWLAKVGYERVQEIENPELAQKRMKTLYKLKGYSNQWIEKRVRGIAIRDELTDEWKNRDVKEDKEFAILTAEISKATFGMTPTEYKKFKNLPKQSKANLRDHMNDLELIFTMLGEKATTEIAKTKDTQGFKENKVAAVKGGKIAGDARAKLEIETKKKVSTDENYLQEPEKHKKIKNN